jgi:hypothetical protein
MITDWGLGGRGARRSMISLRGGGGSFLPARDKKTCYLEFWKLVKNGRKKGEVFKPSFKYFKNDKINFIQAFLKLETLLFQNMFILSHHILY